ncbi:MAG: MBL fold metallo-hydrolase [Bdellovibrionaceae bacterium]|nr:MBL fold metallo-hydrolase [Pseudobdellovibrionaceae bacterium]
MIEVKPFYDAATFTLTFLVYDSVSKDAVVIDPVMDYDPQGSVISHEQSDAITEFLKNKNLSLHYIIETHAHADHLSSSQVLKKRFPKSQVVIHEKIKEVQKIFKGVFNLEESFPTDGSQFDRLLKDDETFNAGSITIKVLHTPGHTPACASFLIENHLFTGDALFMPDYGTGRCDFPSGSSENLFDSIQKIYQLPDSTKVYVGHDYQPNGRALEFESTIGEEKRSNIQLNEHTKKDDFVQFRNRRDNTLKAPRLLLASIQVNINAGHLPKPESNGKSYLKIPLNVS